MSQVFTGFCRTFIEFTSDGLPVGANCKPVDREEHRLTCSRFKESARKDLIIMYDQYMQGLLFKFNV